MRRQAANALARELQIYCNLQEEPTVISAPPSEVADYPRVAVWLEHFKAVFTQEDELEVDDDDELMIGARATLSGGVGPATIQPGVQLSHVGSIICSGRIWVGCRLPPKREEIEEQIRLAFVQDASAIGRLMVTIPNPKVGAYALPWRWTGTALIGDSDWTDEYAFSERLWAWIKFELDVPMLAPRHDPIIRRFLLKIDAEFGQPNLLTGVPDNSDGTSDDVTVQYEVPVQ